MQGFATYASEYGPVRVDWQDDAVVRLRIIPQADYDADGAGETTGLTDETFRELEQYFAGELRRFTVPIAFASGTPCARSARRTTATRFRSSCHATAWSARTAISSAMPMAWR